MPVLLVGLLRISELAANSVLSQRIPLSHSTVICEHLRTGQSGYLPQHLTEIYTVDLEQGWGWSADICTAKNPSIALGICTAKNPTASPWHQQIQPTVNPEEYLPSMVENMRK